MLNLSNTLPAQPVTDNMDHGLHYAFYDHSDKGAVGPTMYADLLKSATSSIEIWDPYFNKGNVDDHLLFANISTQLTIYYLTKGSKAENSRLARDKAQKIWDNIPISVQAGSTLYFAYITCDSNDAYNFHDRWLIVDRKRYFIVGGSINYHSGTPTCSTGIYEVIDSEDQQLIRRKFDKFYQHAVDDAAQIVKS